MAAYTDERKKSAPQSGAGAASPQTAWPLFAAVIALLVCFALAWWSWQIVPDAATASDPWWRWWVKPYEQNAFARLPYVGVDVRGAYAAPHSDRRVVVGSNGLILLSENGGDSWHQITAIEWNSAAAARSNRAAPVKAAMLSLFSPAYAASAPESSSYQPAETKNDKSKLQNSKSNVQYSKQAPFVQSPVQNNAAQQKQSQIQQSNQQQSQPEEEIVVPTQVNEAVDLFAISFVDDSTGIAVGARGVILVTQDGGHHWSARHSGTGRNLNAVASVGSASIVVVGDAGTVLISGDDGASWQLQPAPISVDLHGIAFAGGRSVVAVGDGGSILRSEDGGASWNSHQWLSFLRPLYGVTALNQTLLVVGAEGLVLRSQDGGISWTQLDIGEAASLHAATIMDATHFAVAGEGGRWLDSANGGTSWQAHDSGSRSTLRQLLADTGGILAVGDRGTVSTLENGSMVPKVRGADRQLLTAITLKASVLVAGGNGTLLRSDNLGRRWQTLQGASHKSLRALTRVSNLTAIAVGDEGAILRTEDGGDHWEDKTGISTRMLQAVAASDNVVLAGGINGTLLRSEDRGRSWLVSDGGTDQTFVALAFSNPATAMAATDRGLLLRSLDAGVSWNPIDIAAGTIAQFTFADTRNGIAVGAAGTILRTINGGKSWDAVNSGVTADLSNVFFIDALHLLAAGSDGVMIASSDGGSNWKPLSAWSDSSKRSISALVSLGQETAIIIMRNGSIFNGTYKDNDLEKIAFVAASYHRYPAPISVLPLLGSFAFILRWRRRVTSVTAANGDRVAGMMVADRPLRHGDADYMNFGRRAIQLSRFIRHERTELPATLAICAEWGFGKSSLMNLLSDDLLQHGYRPVWFNAWHHQKEGNLLASLLRAVQTQALPDALTPTGFLLRVQLLVQRGAFYMMAAGALLAILLALISYFEAYPERREAIWPNVRYMLDIEQPVTISTQGLVDLEKLDQEDLSPALKYWLPVLTEFRDARHVFTNMEELVAAMRARANPSAPALSLEVISVISNHVDHVRPVQRVFPEVGNVWKGIFAAILAFSGLVLKGMRAFGLSIPNLWLNSTERTGTRERFAADFNRLTRVLGGRLVIMIDDLDRCSRKNLMDMLEHINFLASEGQCVLVVAMAYERVVENLAVSLAQDAGRSVEDGPTERDLDEARIYLHKLIQLMVTIRPPNRIESQHMLVGSQDNVSPRPRQWWRLSAIRLWGHTQPWVIILGMAYLGIVAGSKSLELLTPQSTLPLLQQRFSVMHGLDPTVSTQVPAVSLPSSPRLAIDNLDLAFRAAEPIEFPLWMLIAAGGFLLVVIAIMFFCLDPRLQRLAIDRLRAFLAMPVDERDSSQFLEALNLWRATLTDYIDSPRALKRFLNRLRFIAMGVVSSRAISDGASEAQVVALAAIGVDNVDIEYSKLSPAQRALLDQHIAIFGRGPTEEERELYLDLVGEMDKQALVSPV